jgi:hypothetical protein
MIEFSNDRETLPSYIVHSSLAASILKSVVSLWSFLGTSRRVTLVAA